MGATGIGATIGTITSAQACTLAEGNRPCSAPQSCLRIAAWGNDSLLRLQEADRGYCPDVSCLWRAPDSGREGNGAEAESARADSRRDPRRSGPRAHPVLLSWRDT